MKKTTKLLIIGLIIVAVSCYQEEEDPIENTVYQMLYVDGDPEMISNAKKWYDAEMFNRSNAITQNEIVWDWERAKLNSEKILSVESLKSNSENSTYGLEINMVNDDYSANVYVYTPFNGFTREVTMGLDGIIISVTNKEDIESEDSIGLLPKMSTFSETPGGGSGTWVWDPSINAWALQEVVVTFYRSTLNSSSSYNNIYWTNITSLVNSYPASYFQNIYSYQTGGKYSATLANQTFDRVSVMVDLGPDNPITDPDKLFDCINLNTSATVTLYANQPKKNSSTPIYNRDVGHAFFSIS